MLSMSVARTTHKQSLNKYKQTNKHFNSLGDIEVDIDIEAKKHIRNFRHFYDNIQYYKINI